MEAQKLTKKQNFVQMFKFVLISASAGIIQTLVFSLLNDVAKLPGWFLTYFPALVLSVLWNFTINRRYTFKSAENVGRAMIKVFLFYCVFTPMSIWWGDALEKAGWLDYLVLAFTMIINLVTEYLYCRFFVYRNKMNTNDIAKKEEEKQNSQKA